MAIISVIYKEPDVSTYSAVEITYGNGKLKRFDSGSFVKDWFRLNKFISTDDDVLKEHWLGCSSSFDHFFMDGAQFDSAIVTIVDGKGVLLYNSDEEGLEHFVEKGTRPTWEEFKAICSV